MDQAGSPDHRARELLRRVLTEKEWEHFSQTAIVEVTGARGTYHLCACHLTQITHSNGRLPFANACLQLSVPAPANDRIFAEYMLIRNDENLYWQTANIFPAGLDNGAFVEFLLAAFDAILLILVFAELHF
jgi:hypothetical protein